LGCPAGSRLPAELRPEVDVVRARVEERLVDIGKHRSQLAPAAGGEGVCLEKVGNAATFPVGSIERVTDDDLVPLHERDHVAGTCQRQPGGESADACPENGHGQRCHPDILRCNRIRSHCVLILR